MTSRAGKAKRPNSARRAEPRRSPARGWAVCAAFTLVEVILSISLLAMLAAATAMSLAGWHERAGFDEAVYRFEGALRMARAEACNDGVRLRLSFDRRTGTAKVLREPDPFTRPGQFVEHRACTWRGFLPQERARITRCELTGAGAFRTVDIEEFRGAASDEVEMREITFHPDGTSDSARIELKPTEEGDNRKAVIELFGTDGRIVGAVLTPTEYERYRAGELDIAGSAGTER